MRHATAKKDLQQDLVVRKPNMTISELSIIEISLLHPLTTASDLVIYVQDLIKPSVCKAPIL